MMQTDHPTLTDFIMHGMHMSRNLERQRCADKLTLTKSEIRLMAGEMTAQEMRTVQAVLKSVRSKILKGD